LKSIASAPAKIILFGEHFVVHGTKAILAAIDKRVTVTTTFTENKTIKINSELGTIEVPISSSHEEVKNEFRPFVYLANKIINSDQNVSGLEITIDSDIPIGVGLGSSSACCVAAAASLSAIFRTAIGKRLEYLIKSHNTEGVLQEDETRSILNLAIEAEQTIFPDTSGADCAVCTYGGMIEHPSIEKIDNTFDLNLLIANSMIPHNTKNSVEKVNKFKEITLEIESGNTNGSTMSQKEVIKEQQKRKQTEKQFLDDEGLKEIEAAFNTKVDLKSIKSSKESSNV